MAKAKTQPNPILMLVIGGALGALVTYFVLAGTTGDLQGRFNKRVTKSNPTIDKIAEEIKTLNIDEDYLGKLECDVKTGKCSLTK